MWIGGVTQALRMRPLVETTSEPLSAIAQSTSVMPTSQSKRMSSLSLGARRAPAAAVARAARVPSRTATTVLPRDSSSFASTASRPASSVRVTRMPTACAFAAKRSTRSARSRSTRRTTAWSGTCATVTGCARTASRTRESRRSTAGLRAVIASLPTCGRAARTNRESSRPSRRRGRASPSTLRRGRAPT